MASNSNDPQRRTIRFDNHQEIVDEAQRLIDNGHEARDNWTLGQILEHLARGNESTYEGFDFSVPWLVRTFIGPLMKNRFIYSSMPAGYKFRTKTVLEPPADVDATAALEHLSVTLKRLSGEAPTHPHPLIGYLSHDEWKNLALRHAELHLSFVHPKSR